MVNGLVLDPLFACTFKHSPLNRLESEVPGRLVARSRHAVNAACLAREPMFCFETAVKLWYWSKLCYMLEEVLCIGCSCFLLDVDVCSTTQIAHAGKDIVFPFLPTLQQASDIFTLPEAMKLYGLQHFKLIWEPSCDTKCLLGWNKNTIVIAFRGTASMVNVKADLQFWQVLAVY